MVELSLIINTYNRSDMIKDALDSASKQTLSSELYEVLIVDQSKDSKTENIVKNYKNFRYIKTDTIGLTVSRNISIDYAQGDILVYVDDDAYFDEDYLDNILTFFKTSPLKPDFIGGRTTSDFLGEKPEWLKGKLLLALGESDYLDTPMQYGSHFKQTPFGNNMAIKKDVLLAIGKFKNIIRESKPGLTENEDVILGVELKKQGYNVIYYPDMKIYHKITPQRLTYSYFKKHFFNQGQSDCMMHHFIEKFSTAAVFSKLFCHLSRAFQGVILAPGQKNISDRYYQQLRWYYNMGYINALIRLPNLAN
jgi:glycosyltransferase involved in cell wall biosynthesis